LLLTGSSAWAQAGGTGRLQGVVTDPTGAAVSGAKVTATETATGVKRDASTDASGRYALVALPVGEYSLAFELEGFQQLVRTGVQVEAAVTSEINAELKVGQISEQVTVTEAAPLLNTTQATTFRQINTLELLEVPSSTRNFTHLISAEAGVNADLPQVLGNDTGSLSPSVNGLRTTSNSLQFNGIDATNLLSNEGSLVENIAPAPETIQEVKLQTSLYDASTGRNGGGNFQIVTRGGSNDLHGSAYWFVQNEVFNANDFFFNRDGIDRPAARRNEGGFTLGGPVVRDKAFFFGSYQRTQALTAFVPTGSSQADLPLFLDFLTDRSLANLMSGTVNSNPFLTAINQARAVCGLSALTGVFVDPVGANLFALQNPASGGFIIPAPNLNPSNGCFDDNGDPLGTDFGTSGNPLVRRRQVQPSEFTQDQFNVRGDFNVTEANRLNAVFFFSNFPSLDSFPDPSSLASPFTLQRGNRARTLALSDTYVFNPRVVNEARFGLLFLNNTRSLDDPFLADELTSAAVGINNPALLFDDSPGTRRLGHFIMRGPRFSFGGPNDSFNKRKQMTYFFSDIVSYQLGTHAMRFGFEWRHHKVQNNLPEEQATEFEKIPNFLALIAGRTAEADTQYGVTEKEFSSQDLGWFWADDWKLTSRFTLNLGVRWDWFGWPTEKNGLIGNFDPTIADTENPINGFIIPSNVRTSGLQSQAQAVIDPAVADLVGRGNVIGNKHTLRDQDLNNFQPRLGFAWQPLQTNRVVVRGGYGIFYDRPSAAFINTLFSNYPFLREIEVTFPGISSSNTFPLNGWPLTNNGVPFSSAYSAQDTNLSFNSWLPMRLVFRSNNYEIRDNTGITVGADGTANPNCEPNGPSMGMACLGNIAETFEFRAVDRNLRTPYVQQWNLGVQWEVAKDFMWEIRYVGTKGTRLLGAIGLAEPFDLNDASAPDFIFQRLNDAYVRAGEPRGPLGSIALTPAMTAACAGRAACLQGVGIAYGFNWPTGTGVGNQNFGSLAGLFDLNLQIPTASITSNTTTAVISLDARVPFMGINTPEAIILKSIGNSIYHGLQTNFTKRFSNGLQFNLGYTWSRSIDDNSSDPGSTAGGGKPDVPNTGFIVQGSNRNLRANRGVSDFDRTHRFSLSYVYEIPTGSWDNQWVKGWQLSGFTQIQSGAPYSIFSAEPEARTAAALNSLNSGSGGLYRLGFGRPSLASGTTLGSLTQTGDKTIAFVTGGLTSPLGQNGNLGRNVLRGDYQKRFDMAISKSTRLTERYRIEFRTEFFNLFNNVNFALPVNDLQDSSVGNIENTVGGPRVVQFGLRFQF
jgi:hypothetical protein